MNPIASGLSVATAGHQPEGLVPYKAGVAPRLEALAAFWLSTNHPREIVSGLAPGWDLAVARAALEQNISLVAALAFPAQLDVFQAGDRPAADRILGAAQLVHVHGQLETPAAWTERDRWSISRADMVLALWSGADGGTAQAIKIARGQGKPVVNLWDVWTSGAA
jgi:predicted Rossmann fold nucleotide-binding protein DprA/Smf involved in DNA uptake